MRNFVIYLILLLCFIFVPLVTAQEKQSKTRQPTIGDLKKEIEELKANQQQSLKEIQELKQLIQNLLNALAASSAPAQPVITLNVYGEPFKGNSAAPIAIIEYSDFECPFCGQYAREVYPQIDANYVKTGKVKYFFRDLPLPIHPNALQSARAARCAGEQNKFWEMHDRLFSQQEHLTTNDLLQHAQSLNLDADKFRECMASNKYTDNIRRSMQSAERNGVNGTPAFFIGKLESNGTVMRAAKVLVGLESYDAFKSAIDELLQSH